MKNRVVSIMMFVGLVLSGCSSGGSSNIPTTPSISIATPSISIAAGSATEGNTGTSNLDFSVTLDTVTTSSVTVDFVSSDGSATAGVDYTVSAGTLTIPAGSNTATITVVVAGDTQVEVDETLTVTLSNPSNALLSNSSAVGTITDDDATTPPTAVTMTVNNKTLLFNWTQGANVDHYRISVNPDGVSGFTTVSNANNIVNTATTYSIGVPVHKTNWLAAQYIVESCDVYAANCFASPNQTLTLIDSVAATVYAKASNAGAGDIFGWDVVISSDGSTLAVGAYGEGSVATGIGGNEADNTALLSGAVYVYTKSGFDWVQQAYIKASNAQSSDRFARSIALSSDGNTLAVGALYESSVATGIGGNQADNTALASGAVYVYTRTGITWTQQAYVKASNTGAFDWFGDAVSLSSDGNTLAVGAPQEDSNVVGVGGNEADNTMTNSGAAYVFLRNGIVWAQQAYIKASNTNTGDKFGSSLSLSGDGLTLAVAAPIEASIAVGIGGNEADNSFANAGAVYVFAQNGLGWAQEAYVKASNTGGGDFFGQDVSLSSDGNTLAVGATGEDSIATGVDGIQADSGAVGSGAVYVFVRNGIIWAQQAYIKASNTDVNDTFGRSVALSADGYSLAVGASSEKSAALGVGGDQLDNTVLATSGAVYFFTSSGAVWSQMSYIKASNTGSGDLFGYSVSLTNDGGTLAVGAYHESSAAMGIDGDQADNTATNSGAVYLY